MEFNPILARIQRIYDFEEEVSREMHEDFLVTLSQHRQPSDRLSLVCDYLGFSNNYIALVWLALNNSLHLLTDS